jgi:CheY-like chemotaxis protein/nitrogen-specific signal transduction histidine kinase
LKKFYTAINFIRTNGCQHLQDGCSTRQAVYTNMIWLATYLTFIIHTSITTLFIPVPLLSFFIVTSFIHIIYISCFLLIKFNYAQAGKHLLITGTYIAVAVFDHASNKETYTYLYLFAFLPTAMNIFSLDKNRISIGIYLLLPLIYTLVSKLYSYTYPHFPAFAPASVALLSSLTLILAFTLFLLFAGYMILNNIAKQKKLLVQSISLQATLDNSAAAIWSIDENFKLTAANIKYLESINNEFGESNLKPGLNLKEHPLWQKLPATFRQQYYTVLSGKELVQEIELNGKFYEIKGVPIYDTTGSIHGATFGSRDITATKMAENTLLKAKKIAEDASKAKARFLSNMSHELRTPLNGIIGITRIMQDEKCLPEQVTNFNTLQDLSEHTLQIVNNILDFAKIEAGKASLESKRFNLRRFIDKINSIFSGTAQLKGIKFIVETESQADIFLKGDEVRLSQVLINLIGNAFKFTEKGSVTLKVNVTDLANSEFYKVRFAVIDTGIGIKAENLGKIFESFSQADSDTTRRFGGTGLGLSIADKIINLMNSRLQVESEYKKGTTFFFEVELPKSSFLHEKNVMPLFKNNDVSLNVNILLAEDNKINQIVACRILQKWQSVVTIASNGKEAADCVQKNKFDVILMDLDMPVMDGYESISIIRKEFPEIPVIALTAASFDDMNNYLFNKGFSEVVQKPFVPEDLYNKIVSAIKRA